MLYDQRMDKKIVSSDISLMKSNPSTFKPGLGSEFLSEVSKKRKGTDSLPDYKIQSIVSHPGQLNDIYGHGPSTHANLPLPAVTPPLVAPKGFSFNSEFVSSRPAYAQFHSSSHPIHSLMTNTFTALVSDSYESRSSADVIPNWVESSHTGKNSGHFSPCVSSTNKCVADQGSCTTTVETHKMAMVNNYFDSNGKGVVKDFKGGLLKGNYCGQYTDITDETSAKRRKLSIEEPTSANIGKINHGSHPNLKNCIAYNRHLLDISDERQNQKVVNHLLKPSECEKTWLSCEKSKKSLDFQDDIRVSEVITDSKHEDENHTLESQKSIVDLSDGLASNNSDELKTVDGKISSVSTEKLWDGSLQLNNSTTVSAVAFFKSGEKAQDIKWSDLIEIKGKVRLHAFEKFIQELPRSRTRALMVISLCWKAGSSLSGLKGMEEIANDYKESKRVGFAQICPGIDLYVCPRSNTIITILAKFGFFKGMNAVVEVPNSLIGCVVWRRGCQTSTSTIKALNRKLTSLVQKQPHSSEDISTNDRSDMQNENSKQAPLSATEADGMPLHYSSEVKSGNIDIASHTSTKNKLDDSGVELSNSLKTSNGQIATTLPYNSPIAPVQISPQNVEMTSKGSLRNPLLHAVEAKTVPDPEPARQVPLQPTQVITETHQRNTFCNENLNVLGSLLDNFIQSTAPIPPLQPQTAQRPCTISRENLMETVSKPERCMMHIKGSNNPATRPTTTQTTLLGPASLLSDLSERIIQSTSAITKETNVGFSSSEIPSEYVSEPRKSSLGNESSYVPPGPPLLLLPGPPILAPGPPPSLTQAPNVSASSVDVDDLPEFDFSSACAGLNNPVNRFSWFTNCNSDAAPFTKQSPRDLGKTPTLLGSTTMQSVEVIQKRQLASFADNMIKNYQGSPTETNLQKPILDNKVVMKSSLLHGQLCSHAHNSSVGSISNSIFSRRHRWDESDDDMPEWCPPDLVQQVDQTQMITAINLPSPVNNWNSEFSRRRPLTASPSPTSLGSPRGPILPHSYLSGSRAPSSLSHDPVAPFQARTTLGFNHSIQRSPLAQNATILSSYQTSTSDKGATNTTPWFRNTRL